MPQKTPVQIETLKEEANRSLQNMPSDEQSLPEKSINSAQDILVNNQVC